MSKVIRLTEGDLIHLVKKVIKEQQNQYEAAMDVLLKKYGEPNLCGVAGFKKIWPYDENVKKFQIELNKFYKRKVVAEDGILGPDTKSWICYKGA
jgi:hypothetical protein